MKNKRKLLIKNIAVILLLNISAVCCTATLNSRQALQLQVNFEDITYSNSNNGIHVRLLNNAGVMIETEDTRIYIDPFDLPSNYSNYPADAILITHNHGDHYDPASIDIISTDNTSYYFPAIMTMEALQYGATTVIPEDIFAIDNFNVCCFYMYTMPGSPDSSHPQSYNYTSYIIEIEGFTIFHAGDSWNIDEYEQLTGEIDLVLLPLGPGCQTMTGVDVVSVLMTIEPSYFIPIHYTMDVKESFLNLYRADIEDIGCQVIDLDYYDSYNFSQPDTTNNTTEDTTSNTIEDTTSFTTEDTTSNTIEDTTSITIEDTTSNTTTDNGSNIFGFSLITAILTGVFLVIRRIKRKKNI
ncbi:MAG: MBL fold metallo-hydrolase [Promethearchaeota archaeon]